MVYELKHAHGSVHLLLCFIASFMPHFLPRLGSDTRKTCWNFPVRHLYGVEK